jgi:hypothetical protein
MHKKGIHIIIALFLVVTTSSSVWGQYIAEKEGIELSEQLEKDTENNEKELKSKFDGWDSFHNTPTSVNFEIFSGFLKSSSSTYIPLTLLPKKLFIVYRRLKIHC